MKEEFAAHDIKTSLAEIDAHLVAHESKTVKSVKTMTAEQLKAFNLCNVYYKVKPIIKFVRVFLFFRPKWQAAIDEFIAVTDQACPVV